MNGGRACKVHPTGPCATCKTSKLKCSLSPHDPQTGRTNRRAMTAAEVLKFRLKQWERSRSEVKKGKEKEKAGNSSDNDELEDSGPVPSPMASVDSISGLRDLNLESGGSSAANTPADSPSALSPLTLSSHPAKTKLTKVYGARAPKPSAGKPASRPLSQLPLSIQLQPSPLRNESPRRSCSSPCFGRPRVLTARLLQAMMEETLPGFLRWRID